MDAQMKAEEERRKRLDEKWERIKNKFEGYTFKTNDVGTYAHFDEFSSKPNREFVLQKEFRNRGGWVSKDKWRYEWAEKSDKPNNTKPSYDFIDAWNEEADDVDTQRYRFEEADVTEVMKESDIEKVVAETAKKVNVKVNVVRVGDEKGLNEKVQKGLRRGGKGWFDPKTGEVYIYTPNAVSAADAVKTILHEVVGHKGLRELVGKEQYDDVMMNLYGQLPEEVRADVKKVADKKYKGDIAYAMDEYFAGKAEDGVTPSWWGKVVGAVRSIAKNVFGMDIELSDGDVKYLLWRSYKGLRNESDWFDLAEDIAMRSKNKVGEYAEKVRPAAKLLGTGAERFAGEGDKSLVGVHNLTEEKLMKVLKNGGLANPSTAVIDVDKTDFSAYGNISLVMPSRMVDRKSGRNAGTWTADAWTPTYPPVEKVMSQHGKIG